MTNATAQQIETLTEMFAVVGRGWALPEGQISSEDADSAIRLVSASYEKALRANRAMGQNRELVFAADFEGARIIVSRRADSYSVEVYDRVMGPWIRVINGRLADIHENNLSYNEARAAYKRITTHPEYQYMFGGGVVKMRKAA